jgi:3-phosphoshikimate 1-carboxyvinyltransferase
VIRAADQPSALPDHVRIHPARLAGTVRVPGDKSLSHRALLVGALVGRPVAIAGLAPSGDVASSAAALRTMGATVSLAPDRLGALHGTVTGPLTEPTDVIDCGNSGTSLRLLAGVAAGLDGLSVLTGDASLRRRPVDRVAEPLVAMGARIDARDGGRRPPLVIRGGRLRAIDHRSPVASAQVKSCVLLAGLTADGTTSVTSPVVSRDHTERLLAYLGADVEHEERPDGSEVARIRPSALTARSIEVAADPSSAAFWFVAASVGQGAITVPGVCANPTRMGVVAALRALGADVEVRALGERSGEPVADVTVTPGELGGTRLAGRSVVDAIDELPVLALAGAMSRTGLEVRDAAELRVKESDRIATLTAAFTALGLELEPRPDGYRVPGRQRPGPGTVHAHGDHRIAMTAAIAGTLGTGPVEVTGFHAVASSYPSFLADLRSLGGEVEVLATAPVAG